MLLYIIISLFLILYKFQNVSAYTIINLWNLCLHYIRNKQNQQDSYNFKNAPGFQYAEVSKHPSIQKLNKLIIPKHYQIIKEINDLVKKGYNGYPMSQIDKTQGATFEQNGDLWRPIWIKFLDTYSGISDYLPTLKNIVQEMGDQIVLLHVSLFLPGTYLKPHYGITKGNLRYHYGLVIPQGDIGLRIHNATYRWKTGEGIQFDDTYLHSAWNKTNEYRLVIFADVPREMNWIMIKIHRGILSLIQYTKHIKEIQEKLKAQNIVID